MAINPQLLEKTQAAGEGLTGAEQQLQAARTEYHSLVRRMHLAGGSLREIAQALGLSHQRVQQMVGGAGGSWWQKVWRSRNLRGNLTCTFCERPPDEVTRLIAGPNVFICDACVERLERSLSRGGARDQAKARCSFCRKRAAGAPVFAGRANICAPCLIVCRQILTDSAP